MLCAASLPASSRFKSLEYQSTTPIPTAATGSSIHTSVHDELPKEPMVQKMMLSIFSWLSTMRNEMTAEMSSVRHTPVSSSVVVCMRLPMEAIL